MTDNAGKGRKLAVSKMMLPIVQSKLKQKRRNIFPITFQFVAILRVTGNCSQVQFSIGTVIWWVFFKKSLGL